MNRLIETKLSLVFFVWVCAITLPWWAQAAACGGVVLLHQFHPQWIPCNDSARRAFNRFLRYALLLSLIVIAVNGVLMREGPVTAQAFGIRIYEDGLMFGIRTTLRLLLLSLSFLAFFASTRLRDVAAYLDTLGLSQALVSVLLLSLYFLEHLPERIGQIFTAQEARGVPVRAGIFSRGKALLTLLSPLLLSSVVESVERSIALELHGYHVRIRDHIPSRSMTSLNHVTLLFLLGGILLLMGRTIMWLIG